MKKGVEHFVACEIVFILFHVEKFRVGNEGATLITFQYGHGGKEVIVSITRTYAHRHAHTYVEKRVDFFAPRNGNYTAIALSFFVSSLFGDSFPPCISILHPITAFATIHNTSRTSLRSYFQRIGHGRSSRYNSYIVSIDYQLVGVKNVKYFSRF